MFTYPVKDNSILLSKYPLDVQHNNSGFCWAQFFLGASTNTVFFTVSIKFYTIVKKGQILDSSAGKNNLCHRKVNKKLCIRHFYGYLDFLSSFLIMKV